MWSDLIDRDELVRLSVVWLPILADAAVKGVIVLGLAMVAGLSLRRASASARHLVWFMVLACLPALPLLSATLPDWRVLPHWMTLSDKPAGRPAAVQADSVAESGSVIPGPSDLSSAAVVPPAPSVVVSETPPRVPAFSGTTEDRAADRMAAVESPLAQRQEHAAACGSVPWQAWVLPVWLAGSLLTGLPVVLGTLSLWRLQHAAERIEGGPRAQRLKQSAKQVGVARRVDLLQSSRRSMPMQWGILRPKLLLPARADDWSDDRWRVVLLHELAHIRRCDCLMQLLARVACALYWFNPLVWVALRQMRLERERACDDLILSTGCQPSRYAEHLLAIVSGYRAHRFAGFCAIAMARPSALEGRLLAILDPQRNRRRLTRAAVILAVAVLLGVVVPMAMIRAAAEDPANGTAAGGAPHEEPTKAAGGEDDRIVQLIEQLGDDRFQLREAAQQELTRIGIPAVAALKAARTNRDAEIAARARRCLTEIDRQIEAKRAEHRQQAEAATKRSDPAEATRRYRALLALPDPPLRDCRAACKFFDAQRDWESLAMAQEATAQEMKRVIHTPVKEFTRPVPAPEVSDGAREGGPTVLVQTQLDGVWVNGKGTAESWIDWLTRKQDQMKRDRLDLLVKLGRLYRDTLGRPKKAVAALEEAMCDVEFFTDPIDKVIARDWPIRPGKHKEIDGPAGGSYVNTLNELSEMQQQAGDLNGAIETKTRQLLAHFILSWDHRQKVSNRPAFELGSLLRRLPADAPLPPLCWLNVLEPENRVVTLDLEEDGPLEVHDLNVLARPGYAFDSLEVTANVEWLDGRGALDCYTVFQKHTVLGRLKWDRDNKAGREELTSRFKVPPEVGLIRFETQPWEIEGLQVHRIKVKATFRPAAANEPPAKEATPPEKTEKPPTPGEIAAKLAAAVDSAEVRHVDEEPTVAIDGKRGYRLVLRRTWKRPDTAQKQSEPAAWDTQQADWEFVLFPVSAGEIVKGYRSRIQWREVLPGEHHVEVCLGKGYGYTWFTKASIPRQELLREKLKLVGGDDRLQLLAEGLGVSDEGMNTANSVIQMLARYGKTALPYVDRAIEENTQDDPWRAVQPLAHIPGEQSTKRLVELYNSQNEKLHAAAAYALIHVPYRQAAKEAYLDMLRRQSYVRQAAEACVKFGWTDALPLIKVICAKPSKRLKHRAAFECRRQLEGKPVDEQLLAAERVILSTAELYPEQRPGNAEIEKAKASILTNVDTEAARVIALSLAFYRTKGQCATANRIGLEILRGLPRQRSAVFLRSLAEGLGDENERAEVQELLEEIAGSGEATESDAADSGVEFAGRVIDDRTGEPVERFGLQWGFPKSHGSQEIGWGGITVSSQARRDGRFREKVGWAPGRQVGLRVLADGYLAQPVTPELVTSPAKRTDLVVRLKRGLAVVGRVLDHTGKPLPGAIVCLGGSQGVTITDGKLEGFSGSRTTTDEQGRFVLSGAGGEEEHSLVVSAPTLHAWRVPLPKPGEEAVIRLPEPATLKIRYDVPGGENEAQFRLYLKTWEMGGWKGVVESVQRVQCGGEMVLKNLTPGVYDLGRWQNVRVGVFGQGVPTGRRDVTLKPGETLEVEFVRKTGYPITGEVVGLKGTGVAGAFIFVKPSGATGDPRNRDEWKPDTFDAQTCDLEGQFKTETIPPGEYSVVVHAYRPEDRPGRWYSGWRAPDLTGTAKVTVPPDRPPAPARIEVKPYGHRPALKKESASAGGDDRDVPPAPAGRDGTGVEFSGRVVESEQPPKVANGKETVLGNRPPGQ